MEDNDFLQKLKSGDRAAFETLVNLYSSRVINTCNRFLLDKEDAQDIAQDVFIEIYQSVHAFRGDAKLSTWIYRITVSKCLDELKRRNRKKRITSIGKIFHIDEVIGWLKGGVAADKPILQKEKMKEVQQALNSLPQNQRVAFTLSKIEGYTNQEIAEIMDTSLSAVETLISRAKKKITEQLTIILKNVD